MRIRRLLNRARKCTARTRAQQGVPRFGASGRAARRGEWHPVDGDGFEGGRLGSEYLGEPPPLLRSCSSVLSLVSGPAYDGKLDLHNNQNIPAACAFRADFAPHGIRLVHVTKKLTATNLRRWTGRRGR